MCFTKILNFCLFIENGVHVVVFILYKVCMLLLSKDVYFDGIN